MAARPQEDVRQCCLSKEEYKDRGHIRTALPSFSLGSSEAAPKDERDEKGPRGVGGARTGSHRLASAAGERRLGYAPEVGLRSKGPPNSVAAVAREAGRALTDIEGSTGVVP